MRRFALLVLALAIPAFATAQAGTLYKWVDSQGRVSYHDRPPPEGAGYRVEQKRVGPGGRAEADEALEKIIEKYPVVLYSVPVCGSCDLARLYLEKRKVPFTEKNLENNPALQEELRKKTGSLSAPTITIGEKVMNGYMESLLAGELDAAGYPKAGAARPPVREDADQDGNRQEVAAPGDSGQPTQP